MIARLCYNCGKQWESEDNSTEVLCPDCADELPAGTYQITHLREIAVLLRDIAKTLRDILKATRLEDGNDDG